MGIERVLLQTIKFDLHVDHPYTFLLQYQKVKFSESRLNLYSRLQSVLTICFLHLLLLIQIIY